MNVIIKKTRNIFKKSNINSCYVGVDWMKGRWIASELTGNTAICKAFNSIEDLGNYYKNIAEIIIDIPIGLPQNAAEAFLRPDRKARNYLKVTARKSSIFPVPYRQLCYVENKEELWNLNKQLGSKLTVTGSGILPCIRQVDSFLQSHPEWRERLVESHPECAFQALNHGKGVENSKHTSEGIEERVSILSHYVFNVREIIASAPKSKQADILDSLCLAVTSKLGYISIPEKPSYDSKGFPMRIVIANIR